MMTNVTLSIGNLCHLRRWSSYVSHAVFDQLFVATDDENVFVFVVVALIARMQPTVAKAFGSFFGSVQVAFHHHHRLHADFSDFSGSQFFAGQRIDNLQYPTLISVDNF